MEAFRELFATLTEGSILLIDFMALVIVVFGTVEAFISAGRAAFLERKPQYHQIWLRYARWLVAALTFQLAADIIESAMTPTWEDIGRLAAIAVIRTFLNYFLGRDLAEEVAEAEKEDAERKSIAQKKG
ncbi:MAG: DUF1622 domain-containing protein [Mesorhizobium sp.]|nr:DUF1622 domain-containing protein [Mesorhizobium sp.]MBL8575656.1 DUF1622 domain-containing protein [Mesorhizobium sp.]